LTSDKSSKSIGEESQRIGYKEDVAAKVKPVEAAFDVHIEQGPILETGNAKPEELEAGCNVLLHAILDMDGRQG
jgi:hypothetical protein